VWAITVNSAGCLKPVSRHAIHRVVLVRKREDLAVPITPTATQPLRTLTAMASASQRISLRAATTGRVLLLAVVSRAAIGVPARLVCVRAQTVWATTASSAGWQHRRSLPAIRLVDRVHKRVALCAQTIPMQMLQLRTLTAMASASQRISLRAATTGRVLLLAAVLLAAIGVPARLVCVRARTVWATTANSAGCLNRRSRHAIHRVVRAHKREDLAVPITPTATQPLRTPTVMELPSQRTSLRAATTVRVLLAVLGSTVGHSAIVTQPLVYAFATPVSPPT